jgi:hypothetical protein
MEDQNSFDEPIQTLEQAKAFFVSMGCSAFHMDREFPERSKEFRELRIPERLQSEWRLEQFELKLGQLSEADGGDLWRKYADLVDLSDWSHAALEQLLEAAKRLLVVAPRPDLVLIAMVLLDSNAIEARTGAVLRAYDSGYPGLAQAFSDVVFQLLAKAVPNRSSPIETVDDFLVSYRTEGPHIDPGRIEEARTRAIAVAELIKPPPPTLAWLFRKPGLS